VSRIGAEPWLKPGRTALHLASVSSRIFPWLVVLGVAAALAESIGISLIVLFLYSAFGRGAEAFQSGGLMQRAYGLAVEFLPGPVFLGATVIGLIALKASFITVYTVLSARVQNRLGEDICNRLHRQYLEVSYDYVRRRDQGELLNIVATQSWAVAHAYRLTSRILISITMLTVMGCFLLAISWQVTLFAAVGSACLVWALQALSKPARRLGAVTVEAGQHMAEQTMLSLQSMRTVRAFGQEAQRRAAFEKASASARLVADRMELVNAIVSPLSEVGYVCLLLATTAFASGIGLPFASTLTAVALLYRLQGPIRELQASAMGLAQAEAPVALIYEVLRKDNKTFSPQGGEVFSGLREGVEFRAVEFGYEPSETTLADVSFRIPAGKTTALIGASGAGKTTIINLLLRLEEPRRGGICVDGTALSELDRKAWLSAVALAGQDADLMDSSVRANLQIAREGADDASLLRALDDVGLGDLIRSFPDGLDQWIGPHAANLSGGQRQRLAIAQVLLRDPHFIIFDEATSALDFQAEHQIRAMIESRFVGRTLLIVTHRLDTITGVDHAVLLDGGRVLTEGLLAAVRGHRLWPT
jgi:ABC-type multidrug transport system fused ATPase/permease subunit